MRIFSNIPLSWPQVIHVSQATRIYPGRWQNYYFFRIYSRKPTQIITYSPINLLQMNIQYYCYDNFYRDKRPEELGNSWEMITLNNKAPPFPEQLWINIPKACDTNDIIAIKTTEYIGEPSISYSNWNLSSQGAFQ